MAARHGGEYSKSHYSPRLKRIIILAYTNSVTTQHIQEKLAGILSLISFNFSQRIDISGRALTVGCLISMRNLCMKLTVCAKMAALQTSFEVFFKIGNRRQCPLKLTGQNYCSGYLCL